MQKLQSQGVHHITLVGAGRQTSIDFWEGVLGMPFVFEQPNLDKASESHLYFDPGDGRLITIFTDESRTPEKRRTPTDPGCVHHIAFAVENRAAQLEVRKALLDTGYHVTPVIDRDYFWAIYFRTPGGVLFEVATNEPGFDRDEDTAHLGQALKLPTQHAHLRSQLESILQPIVD